MRISDLLKKLEEMKNIHGDAEVTIPCEKPTKDGVVPVGVSEVKFDFFLNTLVLSNSSGFHDDDTFQDNTDDSNDDPDAYYEGGDY